MSKPQKTKKFIGDAEDEKMLRKDSVSNQQKAQIKKQIHADDQWLAEQGGKYPPQFKKLERDFKEDHKGK